MHKEIVFLDDAEKFAENLLRRIKAFRLQQAAQQGAQPELLLPDTTVSELAQADTSGKIYPKHPQSG